MVQDSYLWRFSFLFRNIKRCKGLLVTFNNIILITERQITFSIFSSYYLCSSTNFKISSCI